MHLPLLFVIAGAFTPPPADTLPPPIACDAAALRTPVGSAIDTVVLTLRRADGSGTRLPSPWADSTLRAIARHLALPDPVPLPVWATRSSRPAGAERTAADTIVPTLSNAVLAVVTADGRLHDGPTLVASSLDARVDAALVHAVRAADRARALAPAPVDTTAPREALRVIVGLAVATGDTVTPAVRVALVRRDRLLLTDSPKPIAAGRAAPRYPARMLEREQEGSASVVYVVDERGAPVAGTMSAVRYTDPAFARAALDFVATERLTPARVAGCAVPMLVRQPFTFRMEP